MVKWSLPGRGYEFIRVADGVKIGLENVKQYVDSQYSHLNTMELIEQLDTILDELYLQLHA